jgi:GNAT superfamily N-acetyltransferase
MSIAYPPEAVTLRDGAPVTIRAIQPDDAPRLQALHARLSAESIFLRFLGQLKTLPPEEAQRLARVDYEKSMALVATHGQAGEEPIIGVARYAASNPAEPDAAEAAIVVEDAFQGRGLGSLLLDRLMKYARAHGVRYFLATVHHSNAEIMRFIERSGLPVEKRREAGVWEVRVRLDAGR